MFVNAQGSLDAIGMLFDLARAEDFTPTKDTINTAVFEMKAALGPYKESTKFNGQDSIVVCMFVGVYVHVINICICVAITFQS